MSDQHRHISLMGYKLLVLDPTFVGLGVYERVDKIIQNKRGGRSPELLKLSKEDKERVILELLHRDTVLTGRDDGEIEGRYYEDPLCVNLGIFPTSADVLCLERVLNAVGEGGTLDEALAIGYAGTPGALEAIVRDELTDKQIFELKDVYFKNCIKLLFENIDDTNPVTTAIRVNLYRACVDKKIAEHGHFIQGVFDPEGKEPNIAYTVGLEEKLGAELIVIAGVDISILHEIVNDVAGQLLSESTITEGKRTASSMTVANGNGDLRINLVRAAPNSAEAARIKVRPKSHYGVPPKAVYQIFLGDEQNKLPGEEGYNDSFIQTL